MRKHFSNQIDLRSVFLINYEIVKSIFPQLAPGKRNFKVVELEFPNKVDHVPELSNLLVVYHVDCTLGLSITILADVLILSLKGEMVNFFPAIFLNVML